MRVLAGIFSCWRQADQARWQRETWMEGLLCDRRFFLGEGRGSISPDEVCLPCGDSYQDLTKKLRLMAKWTLDHGYDFLWKADLDTYANPARLLASGFEEWDEVGCFTVRSRHSHQVLSTIKELGHSDYPCGGAGTWYSAKALKALVDDYRDYGGASDEWAGHVIAAMPGARMLHDPRYHWKGKRLNSRADIAVHLGRGTGRYEPQWMIDAHKTSL